MVGEGEFILICIGSVGILFFVVGILVRLGIWRAIYAAKGYPVYMPRALGFVLIPSGVMFLLLWLILSLPVPKETRGDLVMYVLAPTLISTYILAMWQPWWLKPKWLRWLEEEHGTIIELLWEDVRKNLWGWERRVRTQKDLEKWVDEVRRKHGLV